MCPLCGNTEVMGDLGDLGDLVISRGPGTKAICESVEQLIKVKNWHNKHEQMFHEHFTQKKKENLYSKGLKNAGIFCCCLFLLFSRSVVSDSAAVASRNEGPDEENASVFLIKCELKLLAGSEREASW